MFDMKVSIFTPTHNTQYLPELYESIQKQTHKNWEWVVVLNNWAVMPETMLNDKKIISYQGKEETKNIWYRKNKACSLANWEILLEADHDDILTEDCLEEVVKAFKKNPNVWFVYSDNAKLWPFAWYDPQHWWELSRYNWKDMNLPVMKSLPEIPNNLSYIRFQPDHVRAWRKTVYDQIGGHNPGMEVCDDQELMIRTYLISDFMYIPKVLYIYRITWNNTSIDHKSKIIQQKTVEIYDQYIYKIATKRSEKNNLLKIDLCWWIDPAPGFQSIDIMNGDIVADLNKKWPLEDNSVGVIRAHDAMEHLVDKIHTMQEIHRVLAPGWILLSSTPSTDGRWAFQDPTHVAFWNENSFRYWIKWRLQSKYIYNTEYLFMESRLHTWFPSDRHKKHNISYVQANLFKPYFNV